MKKAAKKATNNTLNSLLTTLSGVGIAALSLWANGTNPKQIGISAGIAALGALAKDPNK